MPNPGRPPTSAPPNSGTNSAPNDSFRPHGKSPTSPKGRSRPSSPGTRGAPSIGSATAPKSPTKGSRPRLDYAAPLRGLNGVGNSLSEAPRDGRTPTGPAGGDPRGCCGLGCTPARLSRLWCDQPGAVVVGARAPPGVSL